MDEFYVRNISNGRKHEIETQLNNFSNQKDAWKFCVYFITNTSSQYVSMYALSTIEVNRFYLFYPIYSGCNDNVMF